MSTIRLAVFTKNHNNPAYGAARIGANRAAAKYGASVTHFVPDIPDDPEEQSDLIDKALTMGVDAFVLSPVHTTKVNAAIQRIAAAAIPIVAFVNPIDTVPSVTFVGADDARMSQELASYLFRHLGGLGRVLLVTGPEQSITSLNRVRGFHDAVATAPGISVAGQLAGNYQRDIARVQTAQWLRTHNHPDSFFVANDIMAMGVLEAMDKECCTAPVVGVNAIPEAIASIAAGRMLATADFNAMQMAYLATECAIRHLRGETVPANIELPVQIVDRSNCGNWDLPYEQRRLLRLADLSLEA